MVALMDRQEVLVPTKFGESPGWSSVRTHQMGEIQARTGRSGKKCAKFEGEGITRTERVGPRDVPEDLNGAF